MPANTGTRKTNEYAFERIKFRREEDAEEVERKEEEEIERKRQRRRERTRRKRK